MTTDSSVSKLTYEHYVLFPNDGNRHEVIDGRHYMNPTPSTYHQVVSKRLQYELYTQIELARLGNIFSAPLDVELSRFDIVQPDLVALANQSQAKITASKIVGPPELLIEIISPSSVENDLVLKRTLYQQSGVQEYWIVDPFERCIKQLVRKDGVFIEATAAQCIVASTFPSLTIELSKVW